jgi:probable F420-dependent oxidoreductase
VRYGFCLPHHRPYASRELVLEAARRGEAAGYDTLWLSDHIVPPLEQVMRRVYLEPLVLTGWVAAATSRVKLGYSVLVIPQRNPVLLAKQLATIDVMSEGRIIVGVGVGYLETEFRALNADYHRRGHLADEYLRVMHELWTNPDPEFHGDTIDVEGVYFWPKPLQRPGPPIIVGGHSAAALRRAVELGDGWQPDSNVPLDQLAARIAEFRRLRNEAGRPAPTVSYRALTRFAEASSSAREPFTGSPEAILRDFETCAEAGVDELNVELGGPWMESGDEWLADFERLTADVLPHAPR